MRANAAKPRAQRVLKAPDLPLISAMAGGAASLIQNSGVNAEPETLADAVVLAEAAARNAWALWNDTCGDLGRIGADLAGAAALVWAHDESETSDPLGDAHKLLITARDLVAGAR